MNRSSPNLYIEKNRQRWAEYGFVNLLLWLLAYMLLGPCLESFRVAGWAISLVLSVALISAVVAISSSKRLRVAGVILVLPALVVVWLQTHGMLASEWNLTALALAVFLIVPILSIGSLLFRVRRVTSNVICAALCLYLLVGLMWATWYALIESITPGSFAGTLLEQADSPRQSLQQFEYLSFVTLSTLGYGDITPQTRIAASACQAEAIVGQFLMVVTVARLVGIQVAQQSNDTT